jgi:hypothetical protein
VFPDACAQHEPAAQRIVDAYLAGVNLHQTRVECQPVISSDGWAASILGGEVTSGFRTADAPTTAEWTSARPTALRCSSPPVAGSTPTLAAHNLMRCANTGVG